MTITEFHENRMSVDPIQPTGNLATSTAALPIVAPPRVHGVSR